VLHRQEMQIQRLLEHLQAGLAQPLRVNDDVGHAHTPQVVEGFRSRKSAKLPRMLVEAERHETRIAVDSHFGDERGFVDGPPKWILIQTSPLVAYSQRPSGKVERVLRSQYALVCVFRASRNTAGQVYDQQDAFFLPLAGFAGVERPGPNFELYRRRR